MKTLSFKSLMGFMAIALMVGFVSCTESPDTPVETVPVFPDSPKSSYENPMEWMGYAHNKYLAAYDKSCNAVEPHDIGYLCFRMDSSDVSEFCLSMVDSLGQPYVNTSGTLSIAVPKIIEAYLQERPVLSAFQDKLLLVVSDEKLTITQKYNAIVSHEKKAEKLLTGPDLDAMYAVGAVARHFLVFWSQRKLSPLHRYMARDFTALWTVGVVSIWFPGVGLGAAVAAGAVSSATTDL